MLLWTFLQLSVVLLSGAKGRSRYKSGNNCDYCEALHFLREQNEMALHVVRRSTIASWNYEADLSEHNKEEMLQSEVEGARFWKESWKNATSFAWKQFKDRNETIYRWFKALSTLGVAALSEDKLEKYNSLGADMENIYATAKVCAKDSPSDTPCKLSLEPELTELFAESRDYDKLKHAWIEWRKITGRRMRESFLEYLKMSNEVAELNGYGDTGEMWREDYESPTFVKDLAELFKVVEPFYIQLHAYVRRRLIQQYPERGILPDGPIPAHLLGNMWGESWGNIFDVVKPYKNKESVDVSVRMKELKMTPLDMFKISEEFFTSLGLMPMTEEFWNRSIIEKPKDREMVCHASAWDFYDGKDFRIKMCTEVTLKDLAIIHHEMGHIQYFQQYAHQPLVFREAANPGFHEAVGDALALSVTTYSHLKKIGLMNDSDEDEEMEINELMKKALEAVAFVPFGYLIDSWRWKVFSGKYSENELNSKWWEERWKYRCVSGFNAHSYQPGFPNERPAERKTLKYQGLCPPVRRTDEDLDAASKYHVIADIPYIRYFVAQIIQFQFHKGLCEAAGHTGPLHRCDIYQNKEAGKLLSDTLSLGSSVHWSEAMKIITRSKTDKMDAQPMLDYFEPLVKWLQKKNRGETLGWKSKDPMVCP